MLEVAARSIPGSAHPYEDRILVDEKVGLFAVADGVTLSSRGSGAVAAELALSLLRENFSRDLASAISEVHQIAVKRRKEDITIGETTLTAVVVNEGGLQAANVGDSPAYLVRAKKMQSLIVWDKSPYGHITQVIGYPEAIRVHTRSLQLMDKDMVIVASDGVEHVLRSSPFVDRLQSRSKVSEVADSIIQEAAARITGYDDDKSVIILRVVER